MTTKENPAFLSVEKYLHIPLNEVLNAARTIHGATDRMERIELTKSYLLPDDRIHQVFRVDKGHPAGPELHCVTLSGLIFILNERKYLRGHPCFITVLFGRPNQVQRLYEACGLTAPEEMLRKCISYQTEGLNYS